jgi:hypothetical protein
MSEIFSKEGIGALLSAHKYNGAEKLLDLL